MSKHEIDYSRINESQKGALTDPCTQWTAHQPVRRCSPKDQSEMSVLDYGCSIGRASKVFKGYGYHVTVVDVIEKRLKQAEKICDSVFLHLSMRQLLPS